MSADDRCGYFDNGFDKEHEQRTNCRRCLMDRISQLTETVSMQAHDLTLHVQRERALERELDLVARRLKTSEECRNNLAAALEKCQEREVANA